MPTELTLPLNSELAVALEALLSQLFHSVAVLSLFSVLPPLSPADPLGLLLLGHLLR